PTAFPIPPELMVGAATAAAWNAAPIVIVAVYPELVSPLTVASIRSLLAVWYTMSFELRVSRPVEREYAEVVKTVLLTVSSKKIWLTKLLRIVLPEYVRTRTWI